VVGSRVVAAVEGCVGNSLKEERVPVRENTGWWFCAGSPDSHDCVAVGTVETDRANAMSLVYSPYCTADVRMRQKMPRARAEWIGTRAQA